MEDPPDLNYRKIILDDQIDYLLKADSKMHFIGRCLHYQAQDLGVERELLREYKTWIEAMATDSTDEGRRKFFSDLQQDVYFDYLGVSDEWSAQLYKLWDYQESAQKTRERERWWSSSSAGSDTVSAIPATATQLRTQTHHHHLQRNSARKAGALSAQSPATLRNPGAAYQNNSIRHVSQRMHSTSSPEDSKYLLNSTNDRTRDAAATRHTRSISELHLFECEESPRNIRIFSSTRQELLLQYNAQVQRTKYNRTNIDLADFP